MKPVTKLKVKEYTVLNVDYDNLNNFISETYGYPYECVADMEWNNDEEHEYNVQREEIDEYNQKRLDKFVSTGYYQYLLPTLLTDLCNRGQIEEGLYLISISW